MGPARVAGLSCLDNAGEGLGSVGVRRPAMGSLGETVGETVGGCARALIVCGPGAIWPRRGVLRAGLTGGLRTRPDAVTRRRW